MCEIIGVKCKSQDIGISIRESVIFFEKFRLGLDVISEFGELIFTYRPYRLTTNIRPNVLRIAIFNSHCETLDA